MLKGSKLNRYTAVHQNHETRHSKAHPVKSPLSHYRSYPSFKEADLVGNRNIVQNAAMGCSAKQSSKIVQSQVHGIYFKTEHPLPQQEPRANRRSEVTAGEYMALKTTDGPSESGSEQFKSPALNSNKQRAPQIQISPIAKQSVENGFKTVKGPFKRKAAYFKAKSRASSASETQTQEGYHLPESLQTAAKTEADEHMPKQEQLKIKKSFPVPLPPSSLTKTAKQAVKKTNQQKKSAQTRSLAEIDISEHRKKGNQSPSLHQLAEYIINNKPSAILRPKHFDIFPAKEVHHSQTPNKDSEHSKSQPNSQLMKKHSERQSKEKQIRRKPSQDETSTTKHALKDQNAKKGKSQHLSRSRKRTSDLDKKTKHQTSFRPHDTEDEQKTLINKFYTTIDPLQQERQRQSTLKKFSAYRARAFGKPTTNCISQKLLSMTQKKPNICTLYTPSLTLRRTQELSGRRSRSNQNTKKQTISPSEAKRSEKKLPSSQRPYELYKNATCAILLKQVRAQQLEGVNDSTQSQGKSQPSALTPTYDQQRMISYRSQPSKIKHEKRKPSQKRKSNKKPMEETTERESEDFNLVNVQIAEKTPSKSANLTVATTKKEGERQGCVSEEKGKVSSSKKNQIEEGPRYQFTLRQLEKILFSDQQISKHMHRATVEAQLKGAQERSKQSSDQFISIEPSNHKFFEQQALESLKLSQASPIRDLAPEPLKNAQTLHEKCQRNLLSLVELQKLRAKNMKHLRRGAAKIKAKTDAALKIQRWYRRLEATKQRAQMAKTAVSQPNLDQAVEVKNPKVDAGASRNEYMLESQSKPLEGEMSSTQRVQNLIKQKIEKRHREAMMDSFQLQSQMSSAKPQNLRNKVSEEFTQGELMSAHQTQRNEGETSRRSGLILVGRQLDELQSSRQHLFNQPFAASHRNGNEMNNSVTLSRLMLEESLNTQILPDRKQSLQAESKQLELRPRSKVKSTRSDRSESIASRIQVVTDDLRQLDIATNALSPILLKQNSSTLSVERQSRDPYEEQKSQNQQAASDNKMRRFEDKFPTPQQIYRVNSQNSLQMTGNRNHELYMMPANSNSRPSRLMYTCGSGSSMLVSQRSSQMICSQVSQESPVCQRLIHDGQMRPLESQTQLLFSPMSEMQVHVEDQHNDSQLSFQNEDSKSDPYTEAPFEKSQQDIQRSDIIHPSDIRPVLPANDVQEQEPEGSRQDLNESQRSVRAASLQQSEDHASAQARSEYTQEGLQNQQRDVAQSGISPYSAQQRPSNSLTAEQSSSSINSSAAPCSGSIQRGSARQQIETRPVQRELHFVQEKPETDADCIAPDNSLIRTTPDPLSQLKSVDSSFIEPSPQQDDQRMENIDYQTLQLIKKENDMVAIKLEVCNQIFEMLLNEIKTDLFPKRQAFIEPDSTADKPPQENPAPEPETMKQIVIDEKKLVRRQAKTTERPQQTKPRSEKGNNSKTQPSVKFTKNGKPLPVSFERFKIGQSFFKELRSKTDRSSQSFDKFMLEYLKSAGSGDLTEEGKAATCFQFHQIEACKQDMHDHFTNQLAQNEKKLKSKLARKKLGANSLKEKANGEDDLVTNLRGIKTSTEVAEQYVENLFESLLQNEQDFLDSLATPFVQNPLVELHKIQKQNMQARQISQSLQLAKPKELDGEEKGDEHSSFEDAVQQQPVLSVEIYLDIERRKEYVLLADSVSEIDESHTSNKPELIEQQSMLAEWENIHNKVIFDAVNDALDEFRPYGLKGPPAPWSGQTRALTYRFSQNAREVLSQVREKVLGLSKTFGGALANSELLKEYHIKGPLEPDKLAMLREERLAIMMIQDCEDCQRLWEDTEQAETGVKFELADLILDQLVQETLSILQGTEVAV